MQVPRSLQTLAASAADWEAVLYPEVLVLRENCLLLLVFSSLFFQITRTFSCIFLGPVATSSCFSIVSVHLLFFPHVLLLSFLDPRALLAAFVQNLLLLRLLLTRETLFRLLLCRLAP